MLRDIAVIKILNSEIVDNLKKKGKIEEREVNTVLARCDRILDRAVDSKDIERFDQEIDRNEKKNID